METNEVLEDIIPYTRYSSVAWNADNSGFFYTRYPKPGDVPEGDENYYRKLYYHQIGEDHLEDKLIIGDLSEKEELIEIYLSLNKKSYLITRTTDWVKEDLYFKVEKDAEIITICKNLDGHFMGDFVDDRLIIMTDYSLMLNVSNNSIKNLNEGLGIYDCFNTSILNNSFSYSSECGVFISSNIGGIIQSNFVSFNKIGIILRGSSFNVLTDNIIQENELHGIQINNIQHYSDTIYSTNNTLYKNYLISNNQGGKSQAYDEGINNTWHNPSILIGNSWTDWSGEGNYSIDGSSNSLDLYPSVVPPDILSTEKSSYPYFLVQIVIYWTLYELIKNRKLRNKKIKFY
ncbi:hypothetical protein ES705_48787 [subsurface metagenome]